MELSVKGFAVASGSVSGLSVFLITLLSFWHAGEHLGILSHVFIGYSVSYLGSIIGLAYGFVAGLAAGGVFASIYNKL